MEQTLVKLSIPLGEEVIHLSTLDQQAQRNYANLLLIFKLGKESKVDHLVGNIKNGLAIALSAIPDFASTVALLQGSTKNELELRLGPESAVPLKIVHHEFPGSGSQERVSPLAGRTYDDLESEGFPLAMIPREFLFIPHPTCEETSPHGLPALLIQINLVNGGLIMGVSWHHTVGDARAINTFLSSWAHHTKISMMPGAVNVPITPPEQTRERWRLAYGSRDVSIAQFPDYRVDSTARAPHSPEAPHLLDRPDSATISTTLSTWHFSAEALRSLRTSLGNAVAEMGDVAQFTNSEAVSALVWKHLTTARLLHNSDGTSLFSTRIDFRARAKPTFHDDFIGNINEPNARTRMSLNEVCKPSTPQSLAVLAKMIRDAVGSLDEKSMREFIGLVESLPTVTSLDWDYNTLPGPDLAITDTSGLDMLRQDWGGTLGQPVCIRSGSREKGVAYFLPQDSEGGFEVQLQCDDEAVGRLRRDKAFTQYAQFRC